MTPTSRRAGEEVRPSIEVHHPHDVDPRILRQLRAGIEEEGVPHELRPTDPDGDQFACAEVTAEQSLLGVCVLIDGSGHGSVAVKSLPKGCPTLATGTPLDPRSARRLGQNAARIVTRLPFVQ